MMEYRMEVEMVYVLLLDVQYEGQSLLGVYSTLELAQHAGRAYVEHELADVGYWSSYACVAVVCSELDKVARDSSFERREWEYQP
jgi:hypothetical protein